MPVVVTEHAGIPELVKDAWSGLLTPEHDVGLLAEHISKRADDQELARRSSTNGRRTIEERFDVWRLLVSLEAQLVELVVGERTPVG